MYNTVEQTFNCNERKQMKKISCDCNVIHETAVKEALDGRPDAHELSHLSNLFKVMGDETRMHILCLLEHTELCVCDLASALDMTKSAVSHQLSVLKENGLVKSRREGKEVFYSLDDAHVSAIYSLALEHIRHNHREEDL